MFKNIPHAKTYVAKRLQGKHLLNVNSLEIIWSSILLIIMNKLLVRKSKFQLLWHWFITVSYKK